MHATVFLQGRREYMEDRFVVAEDINEDYALYAVFDGHGGDAVAIYCQKQIVQVLTDMLKLNPGDIPRALVDSFVKLDADIGIQDSYVTGSTALVVLQGRDHMWIANCGDSRAILNKGDTVVELSKDHKPEGEELQRINGLGGTVSVVPGDVPRVNGELALTRSIGDKRLRPFVIPIPDIYHVNLIPENKFFVVATDGLWDLISSQNTSKLICETIPIS